MRQDVSRYECHVVEDMVRVTRDNLRKEKIGRLIDGMYTVNIDAGGTMTDGLVVGNGQVLAIKVDSTPHDLTVSMIELINRAAEVMGFPHRRAFLEEVRIIRWSSTVTSNVLAERRGPKIGLLVDAGQEQRLYGQSNSPAVGSIVPVNSVIGLKPGARQASAALAAVRKQLENGVRRICISFGGAFSSPGEELELKRLIMDQFPDHYLGAVPVLLGSEMVQSADDMTRTHYSAINAYVHGPLASSLFKAEDRLKIEDGWRGTLLVGHTNGGMARIGKTKAIDTIESGPIFGTHAAAYFARHYGLSSLLCVDVGGTTTKVSVVRDGLPAVQRGGDFFGIPVKTRLQVLRSLALGGGSVVACEKGRLKLGPRSMGVSPGPACYGLGGTEATLTDCLLVLGYLDPVNFFEGRRRLHVEKARDAIARHVAGPLGLSVEDAAVAARDEAVTCLVSLLKSVAAETGIDPVESPVFAYGGNGPLLMALAAERLKFVKGLYVSFALGPVFSAFGTAISNVVHVYERGIIGDAGPDDIPLRVERAVSELFERGRRDIVSEGFDPDAAEFSAELEIDAASVLSIALPPPGRKSRSKYRSLPKFGEAVVRVRVELPVSGFEPAQAARTEERHIGPEGDRPVWIGTRPEAVSVYDGLELRDGDEITGPAVVTGGSFSCLVPRNSRLKADRYGNGIIV